MKKPTNSVRPIAQNLMFSADFIGPTYKTLSLNNVQTAAQQIRPNSITTADILRGEISPDSHNDQEKRQSQLNDIINLSKSIIKNGLLSPPVVYAIPGGKYCIIAGERRYLATLYAATHLDHPAEIEAKTYPKKPPRDIIEDIQFVENNHRENLQFQDVIRWTLRRFSRYEKTKKIPIEVADIIEIMNIKKTQSYHYRNIYHADLSNVTELLGHADNGLITSLKQFAELATRDTAPNQLFNISQDEHNQIAEKRQHTRPARNGFSLGRCQNPHALESLILKNTPAKHRKKYMTTDWSDQKSVSKAFRAFIEDWESRY